MRQLLREERELANNVVSLYGVEAINLLVPLLTVPLFARILGPSAWGMVLFGQAVAAWVTLVVEYGFGFSATRAVAQGADKSLEFGAVTLAKTGIATATSFVLILLFVCVPTRIVPSEFIFGGLVAGIAQGIGPLWLLNGLQRMRGAAFVAIATRILWAIAVCTVVVGPQHAPLVLWLLAAANLASTFTMFWMSHRLVPWHTPSVKETWCRIKDGWSLFLFTAASGVYGAANVFILGLTSTTLQVSWFGSSDTIRKAGLRLLVPIGQALFPRVSASLSQQHPSAKKLALMGASVSFAISCALALCMILFAAPMIQLVMGPGYGAAVPVIQILALQLPLTALSRSIGVQWMLPHRMDTAFRNIVLFGCGLNLLLALILMPKYGAIGAAWCLVIVESVLLMLMLWCVHKSGKSFLPASQELEHAA